MLVSPDYVPFPVTALVTIGSTTSNFGQITTTAIGVPNLRKRKTSTRGVAKIPHWAQSRARGEWVYRFKESRTPHGDSSMRRNSGKDARRVAISASPY